MSKFLILSEGGDGVGLARRLSDEGHEAKLWIRDPAIESRGQGIVEHAKWHSLGQIVISDCTGFGALMDKFRDEGVRTFGGSSFADSLESDRSLAKDIMEGAEIETPTSKSVSSWEEAAEAIEEIGKLSEKIVLKPEGASSGNIPSFVASNVEEALKTLEQFKREHPADKVELTIQEFVEGIAVSTEGWFNGHDWVSGMFNHTIESKHFLDGDLGPSGGCTGNLVWPCDSEDPLVKQTLTKLTEVLQEHVYIGPIDINCIVNEDGIYGLEFTPRFGYDAFPTLLHSLCDFDFGSFVDSLICGGGPDFHLVQAFGAGVRLSLPPWPSEKYNADENVPLEGFDEDSWKYFYPYGVKAHNGDIVSTGEAGILGVMNYEGLSIGQALACVYYQIAKLRIPNVQYRTDFRECFLQDFRKLRNLLSDEREQGWIGVDLDGTLATYSSWSENIGSPIPNMVKRVKRWVYEGKEVRVFTARGSIGSRLEKNEQLMKVHDWIEDNIGEPLEVTDRKDPELIRLYDDRVVQVEANEGVLVAN